MDDTLTNGIDRGLRGVSYLTCVSQTTCSDTPSFDDDLDVMANIQNAACIMRIDNGRCIITGCIREKEKKTRNKKSQITSMGMVCPAIVEKRVTAVCECW